MVACEQTPLPSGKIGQGAPSPIFPERRGGVGGGSVHRLHCGDGERSTFNFTLNLANKNPGYPPSPAPAFAPARVMDHAEKSVLFRQGC